MKRKVISLLLATVMIMSAFAFGSMTVSAGNDDITLNFSAGANGHITAKTTDGSLVSSGDIFDSDDKTVIMFSARPNTGYEVDTWSSNVTVLGTTDAQITLDTTGTITVTVTFKERPAVTIKPASYTDLAKFNNAKKVYATNEKYWAAERKLYKDKEKYESDVTKTRQSLEMAEAKLFGGYGYSNGKWYDFDGEWGKLNGKFEKSEDKLWQSWVKEGTRIAKVDEKLIWITDATKLTDEVKKANDKTKEAQKKLYNNENNLYTKWREANDKLDTKLKSSADKLQKKISDSFTKLETKKGNLEKKFEDLYKKWDDDLVKLGASSPTQLASFSVWQYLTKEGVTTAEYELIWDYDPKDLGITLNYDTESEALSKNGWKADEVDLWKDWSTASLTSIKINKTPATTTQSSAPTFYGNSRSAANYSADRIEIAVNMLEDGVAVDKVVQYTGLPKDVVDVLK